jgi:hypothetical protein
MLKSILSSPALQPIIMGQIRHVVGAAGASLATAGYIAGTDVQVGVGAVMTLISIIWSAISKKMAA